MICVHRLRGDEFWVNPDLIVFVDGREHETSITFADGNHVMVADHPDDIAAAVVRFRASVLVTADHLAGSLCGRIEAPDHLGGLDEMEH